MSERQEQHAQYGDRSIRMHPDHAPGGSVPLVLARRARQDTRPTGERVHVHLEPTSSPDELDNDALYDQRAPSSTRRYAPVAVPQGQTRLRVQHHRSAPIKRRASQDFPAPPSASLTRPGQVTPPSTYPLSRQAPHPGHAVAASPARPPNWWYRVGISMLVMFFGWVVLSHLASWWETTRNDWQYGRPRTVQVDAVVGHLDGPADPSHFTVENVHRHVVVIEFEGGDPSKAIAYVGPTLVGPDQDLTPVTVSFADVNHDGTPDLILTLEGSHVVYLNTGKAFRPVTPADHLTL